MVDISVGQMSTGGIELTPYNEPRCTYTTACVPSSCFAELISAEPSFSFTENPFRVHQSSSGVEETAAESGTHISSKHPLPMFREGRGGWEADVEERSDGGMNLTTSFAPHHFLLPGMEQLGGVESPVPKWRQQVFEDEDGNEGEGLEEPWKEGAAGGTEEEGWKGKRAAEAGMGAGRNGGGDGIGSGGEARGGRRGQWWMCCGGGQKAREGSGGGKRMQGGAAGVERERVTF